MKKNIFDLAKNLNGMANIIKNNLSFIILFS